MKYRQGKPYLGVGESLWKSYKYAVWHLQFVCEWGRQRLTFVWVRKSLWINLAHHKRYKTTTKTTYSISKPWHDIRKRYSDTQFSCQKVLLRISAEIGLIWACCFGSSKSGRALAFVVLLVATPDPRVHCILCFHRLTLTPEYTRSKLKNKASSITRLMAKLS